jgi:hypothetical protein
MASMAGIVIPPHSSLDISWNNVASSWSTQLKAALDTRFIAKLTVHVLIPTVQEVFFSEYGGRM